MLSREAPRNDESNESRNDGGSGRIVWRKVATASRDNTPLAQVVEEPPQQPAARLIDTTRMQSSTPTPHHVSTHGMENPQQPPDKRKVVIKIPKEQLASLGTKCDTKASVTLLGRIQGRHPGLQTLTTWAQKTLHPSLKLLLLKANNVFEVTFAQQERAIHALNQVDLMCEAAAIFFSSWRPHFDASTSQGTTNLDHPVWMQVVNLCQVLREEEFLRTIG